MTQTEVAERKEHARRLVGLRIASVRYVTLDYSRLDRSNGPKGPRLVTDPVEWAQPAWRFQSFDSVDFAVELSTDSDRVFSVAWDPIEAHEGIGLRESPALGTAIRPNFDAAVWDVTAKSRWNAVVGDEVTDVTLHYRAWESEGFWCPRISLTCAHAIVELFLGEGHRDQVLHPAADNIAVVFAPVELPDWAIG